MLDFFTPYQVSFYKLVLLPAFVATFQMLIISTVISTILGFLLAILLIITNKGGILENKYVYAILSFIINVIRSFPMIILVVAILPFTKLLVGQSYGVAAAIVPLVVAATAFISKIIENALQEVDKSLLSAMRSFGLSETQIVFRVRFSEAMPAIISGIILATISILGATAVAGALGAGGIGAVALQYGYQSFNKPVMFLTVTILIILVQVIQSFGDFIYRKMK